MKRENYRDDDRAEAYGITLSVTDNKVKLKFEVNSYTE